MAASSPKKENKYSELKLKQQNVGNGKRSTGKCDVETWIIIIIISYSRQWKLCLNG